MFFSPQFHPRLLTSLSLLFVASTALCDENKPVDASKLPQPLKRTIDFVSDVQPLLKSRCYSCHGAEEQESGLRLDIKKRAFEGGDGGKVIVPGKSAASRLIHFVAGLDEDGGIMPPEGEGTPFTEDQIALLRAWIDQGAKWPASADAKLAVSHWSFQSIRQPEPPKVKDGNWVRNFIDAFVLARLEGQGIKPSPEADRATLIRRVYLDLLGLPPTVKQVNEFLADSRDNAYERMIDQALESEHFGERWGRHWLDLARYADSDGYEKDRPRPHAWRYREWVINALNADMPFDQFTIEQIAGDMLPNATIEQRAASGFHRNTLHNTEGGTDKEEDRVKKTVDRTNTMSTIWLGLTLGCAQCHSHKYDPITQREYYQMYAFFNNINETDISAPLPAELAAYQKAKTAFDAAHGKLQAAVSEYEKNKLASAQAEWEKTALTKKSVWQIIEPTIIKSKHGATFKKQTDQSILVSGQNKASDVYTIETELDGEKITAIRLEVLPDKSLVKNGPGRASNGNFVLTTLKATASPTSGGDAANVEWKSAKADFSQKDWEVVKAINDNLKDGWAVSPQIGKRHVAVFEAKVPIGFDGGTRLVVTLDQTYEQSNAHNIGRFRLSATTSTGVIELDGIPADVAKAIGTEKLKRSKEQSDAIAKYYQTIDPALLKLKKAVNDHAAKAPKPSSKKAQAVSEGSIRQAKIHIRGDFLNQGDPVDTKTLDALPEMKPRAERPDRLDLANWLVGADNPLTARVTVNRIWQRYFGRGLVASSDDFGSQGDKPSHPQLLDWLAAEFRESGWKVKRLHKLVLMSATYRQSSAVRSDLEEIDPLNVLLARQRRMRVEAEIIRDLALASSGLLDRTIGGVSVRPPQPSEYSKLTYANSAKWQESTGGDRYRRGLYTFFQRTSPYPMLMTFDAPDSNTCTAQRSTSNTPLQALTIWNDRVFWECAQMLGRRVVNEVSPQSDSETTMQSRAIHAFQLCLARRPEADELDALLDLYREQTDMCDKDGKRTTELIGKQPVPDGVSPVELAGWIAVGRVLINLDEFITRE